MATTILTNTWTVTDIIYTFTMSELSINTNTSPYGSKSIRFVLSATNNSTRSVSISHNIQLIDNAGNHYTGSVESGEQLNPTRTKQLCSVTNTVLATTPTGTMPKLTASIQIQGSGIGTSEKTYTVTPTAIDRVSQFTLSTATLNAGNSITFTITKKFTNAIHRLYYRILPETSWTAIGSITDSSVTTYSWTPSANLITTAKSGTIETTMNTYQGSITSANRVGHSNVQSFTFNIGSSYAPQIDDNTISISDANGYYADFGVMLKGLSRPVISWNETLHDGATVTSRTVVIVNNDNGTTYTPISPTVTGNILTNVGTVIANSIKVSDSRGYSVTKHSTSVKVIDYNAPIMGNENGSPQAYRANSSHLRDEEGAYICITTPFTKTSIPDSSQNEQNFVTIRLYLDDDDNLITTLTEPFTQTLITVSAGNTEAEIKNAHEIKYEIEDTVGKSTTLVLHIPAVARVLSFKEDGNGLAVGMISANDGFECNWDAQFNKNFKFDLIDTGTADTDDDDLYNAIDDMNWTSDIVDSSKLNIKQLFTKIVGVFNELAISKSYSYSYSLAAGARLNITANDFDVDTPTGYVPVAIINASSGTPSNVSVTFIQATSTGTQVMMSIYNHSSGTRAYNATIRILYMKSDVVSVL